MNIKVIASVSLVLLVAALLTTILPVQAQTSKPAPTGLKVTQALGERILVEWMKFPERLTT